MERPDEDLPGDFEDNHDVHYAAALAKPLDARDFTAGLKRRLQEALTRLDTALAAGTAGWVRIITRHGSPWVSVPKLDKLPEPKNLGALKAEVERRWAPSTCSASSRTPRSSPISPTASVPSPAGRSSTAARRIHPLGRTPRQQQQPRRR